MRAADSRSGGLNTYAAGHIKADALPNNSHSPTSTVVWPEARQLAHSLSYAQGVGSRSAWKSQDLGSNVTATGHLPQSYRGHLIARPVPDVTVTDSTIAEAAYSPFNATNASEAQALIHQAFIYNPPTTTSYQAASTLSNFDPNPTEFDAQLGSYLFGNQMGLQHLQNSDIMDHHGPDVDDQHEQRPNKRMRYDDDEHQHLVEQHAAEDQTTSPAASDDLGHGFSPRRGYTFKRDGEPPRNADNKMVCTVDDACRNLTFDRKCEWG